MPEAKYEYVVLIVSRRTAHELHTLVQTCRLICIKIQRYQVKKRDVSVDAFPLPIKAAHPVDTNLSMANLSCLDLIIQSVLLYVDSTAISVFVSAVLPHLYYSNIRSYCRPTTLILPDSWVSMWCTRQMFYGTTSCNNIVKLAEGFSVRFSNRNATEITVAWRSSKP